MNAFDAIGLNENEADTYKALLALGKTTVTQVSEHSGLERTMLYGILNRLTAKGLVSVSSESGTKRFAAAPPTVLLNMLKMRESVVQNEMDSLMQLYQETQSEQDARVYMGKQSVRSLLDELLEENKSWYVIGGTADIKPVLDVYLPQFHRKRCEKNLQFNVLFTQESHSRGEELSKEKFTAIRYLPDTFAAPMHVAITGQKVAFNLWTEQPIGILVKSSQVADSFRKYFDFLWSLSSSKIDAKNTKK